MNIRKTLTTSYIFLITLLIALMLSGCSGWTVYGKDGRLYIINQTRAKYLEHDLWEDYKKGVYAGQSIPAPRIVALTPKQLVKELARQSEARELALTWEHRERGIGGFYNKKTQTVYYRAGAYKVLPHEFCHHVLNVKGVRFVSAWAEEKACK